MPATNKQLSYIESLLTRKHNVSRPNAAVRARYGLTQREARMDITRARASYLIDQLTAS